MAKIDDLIRIIRPMLPSTTNNLQHLKRSRNIVGDGVGKYNDPLWSIGKTDKRPRNIKVLSQAEIDELNRANKARYQAEIDAEQAELDRIAKEDAELNRIEKEDTEAYIYSNGGLLYEPDAVDEINELYKTRTRSIYDEY